MTLHGNRTFSYSGTSCSSLISNKFPSTHKREMLESLNSAGGSPISSSVFSWTRSTFSLTHLARLAGRTLIPFPFKFNSTAFKASIPSGNSCIVLLERSVKSRWISWQRKRGKVCSLFRDKLTVFRAFRFTQLSGRDASWFCSRLSVSNFFRLPTSSGSCTEVGWEGEGVTHCQWTYSLLVLF